MRKVFAGVLAAVAVVSFSPCISAQDLEKGSAPISVEVRGWVLINQSAHIAGVSVPMGGKRVSLSIRNPSGKTVALSAPVGGTGSFSADFTGTEKEGLYRVRAVAPDGKADAETTFRVVGAAGMSDHAVDKTAGLISALAAGVPTLEHQVMMLPASPGREEAVNRLKSIRAKLQEGTGRAGQLRNSLAPVDKLAQRSAAIQKALEPAYEKMGEEAAGAEAAQAQLEEKLRLWGNRKPSTCDDLDTAVAGLEFYSGVVQFMTNAWKDIAVDVAEKTVMDRLKLIPTPKVTPEDVMLAKSWLKTAEEGIYKGWEPWTKNSASLVASSAAWLAGKYLGVYCEQFKGDFKAHFGAQYFAYGKKWWAYNIDLTGKLTLRYQKGSGGGPIRVSGEFEGNAGDFRVWDDLMRATPAMRQYVLFHLTLPPPPAPAGQKEIANEFGKVGRTFAGPYSFLVPVHGIIDGDHMILEVDKATKDYGDLVKGRVWYVLMDPTSPTPIPYIMKTDLPMVKAQFILSRGTHGKPSFPIVVNGQTSTIERTFTRTAADAKGNYKVVWRINIKACNPACP